MRAEVNIFGIYVSSVVVTALLAWIATMVLRRVLERMGAYRHIWHPALFDTSLFVLLWAGTSALPTVM
jgi:hypothetical protein